MANCAPKSKQIYFPSLKKVISPLLCISDVYAFIKIQMIWMCHSDREITMTPNNVLAQWQTISLSQPWHHTLPSLRINKYHWQIGIIFFLHQVTMNSGSISFGGALLLFVSLIHKKQTFNRYLNYIDHQLTLRHIYHYNRC